MWYRPPEVDLNGYPRISNPYCRNIQIRRCEWTQGKKMTQSKLQIKEVNEALVATHHTFTTTYFDNMWDNMWVQFFLGKKYRPPEVDLNGFPRISNPYCRDIQIRTCEWTQGKKMTQSKSRIKNSKLFYMYAALLL